MKKIGLFLLALSLSSSTEYKKELIKKLWIAGEPYNLSKTLVAIAKQESNLGQVKVNLQDPSCGVTMIHIKYFLKRHNIKDTSFNRNLACQRLISNDDLAISEAINILEYAKTRLCGKWGCTKEQWLKVWGYYNAGNNYNSKAGRAYANKIKNIIGGIK